MSGMKGKLGMLAMMAAIMGGNEGNPFDSIAPHDIKAEPKVLPIPKGCKEYHFNNNGDWWETKKEDTIFKCIARSRKSAERKFNNWKDNKL